MHDGADAVLTEYPAYQRSIPDVPDDHVSVSDQLTMPTDKIVEHDTLNSCLLKLLDDVRPDVASASRDQDDH
jgi:hypothetical protein